MNGKDWSFAKTTGLDFQSHIRKSIPFYEDIQKNIISITKYFIQPNSKIIDIGTSTGDLISKLYENQTNRNNSYIGIDIEQSMIDFCNKTYKGYDISFKNEDALIYDYTDTSIIFLFLILQFLTVNKREALLKKIYSEMNVGGAIFLYEKIHTPDTEYHDVYNDLYYDFKLEKELSENHILEKNRLLRGIMKLQNSDFIINQLNTIGFTTDIFFKYNNFIGVIGRK